MRTYNKRILLLVTLIFVLHHSVFARQTIQDTITLRVDPEEGIGGTYNQFFKGIKYIPLQDQPQSTVGEISKLEVVDKYFIVLDRSMDQVLIFNRDGSFHAKCEKIAGLSKSPAMVNNFNFNMFRDVAIRRDKLQIVVKNNLDRENLFVYNYDGKFLGKIPLAKESRFRSYAFLDSNTCIYELPQLALQKDTSISKTKEVYLSNNFSSSRKVEIFHGPNYITTWADIATTMNGPFYYSGEVNSCFFTRPYDYNIYKINSVGLIGVYKLVFPISYSVPSDFLIDEDKYKLKRRDYLSTNNQVIFALSNVYNVGDNLMLTINNSKYDQHKIFSYNLRTKSMVSLLNVSADSSSFFLPFIQRDNSIQACDGEHIYSSFSSLELFNANDATKDKHPNYPASLEKYFSPQNRKSNPVIVQMTPKVGM